MRRPNAISASIFSLVTAALLIVIAAATGGTEKVSFPRYQDHVLYAVYDQPEIQEVREAYINPEALKNLKLGQPLPSGTVLTMPTFKARLNEKGEMVWDSNRRLVRGALDRIVVMEKRTGWGTEYPDDLRNGEWEYARFRGDGSRDPTANIKGCFQCHKPFDRDDFVFTLVDILKFAR